MRISCSLRSYWWQLPLVLAVLGISPLLASATEVPLGPVSGEWDSTGNPYNINGDINIPSGNTLVIYAGVHVVFQGHYKFRVSPNATLLALGTNPLSSLITFTSANSLTGWHGLRFYNSTPGCSLVFCRFTYGRATGGGDDANGGALFLTASSPIIQNCQIDSCSAEGLGGGMFCSIASNPVVTFSTISHCTAVYGGGIRCNNSNPTLSGNLIIANSATSTGGGISLYNSSALLNNNLISQNLANVGAGISCEGSNATLNNNILEDNQAEFLGGAIACYLASPTLNADSLRHNSAGNGGALYCYGSSPTLANCVILENDASEGGGIFCEDSHPTITGSVIQQNSAAYGGGIRLFNSDPIISSGNLICQNLADSTGGGIYCNTSDPIISSNTISLNIAGLNGGGLYCINSSPTCSSNTFAQNSAFQGGGICCYHSSPAISYNNLQNNSSADFGGGIYLESGSDASVAFNTFTGNAAHYGAGIAFNGSNPTVEDNTFRWNSTLDSLEGSGGAIGCYNGSYALIRRNLIVSDSATFGGGIQIESAYALLEENTIDSNYAHFLGGGIGCHFVRDSLEILDNQIRYNIVDSGRGSGIFCALSNPLICGNTISHNSASDEGGGIRLWMADSTSLVENNIVTENTAIYGAGIYLENSATRCLSNTVTGNLAVLGGGGFYCWGDTVATITGNIISGNEASHGGGITCNRSFPTISNNTITQNVADSGPDAFGGGIFCENNSNPAILGNTISLNTANSQGGGISLYISDPLISGNALSGNSAVSGGGAIHCQQSHPTILGNTLTANSAGNGGGINCSASHPLIVNNEISASNAEYGGAIYCSENSNAVIDSNSIHHNRVTFNGGAIVCLASSPTITNNTLFEDSAGYNGGAIYCVFDAHPSISGNTIADNQAQHDGGGIFGITNANPSLLNNLIVNNQAITGNGGGLSFNDDVITSTLINNTFSNNSAATNGGGWFQAASTTVVAKNCILWGNTAASGAQLFLVSGASATISYSDIQGDWLGTGNLDDDPLFVDSPNGDFHESSITGSYHNGLWLPDPVHSPCIDQGDPNMPYSLEPEPNGLCINMGAYGNTAQASKSNSHVVNGPVWGTWTLASSPYVVNDSIWVPPDSTLIIQAGVQITFQGHHKFKVLENATLQALGTEQDPVLFTASNATLGWHGLRFFSASDSSRLVHCHLTRGKATSGAPGSSDRCGGAIYLNDSSPSLLNCLIDSCTADSGGAIYCANGSLPQILNNSLLANSATNKGGAVFIRASSPTLTGNLIARNSASQGGGFFIASGSNPMIDLNEISENHALVGPGGGLYFLGVVIADSLNKNTLYGNTSTDSGGGVHLINSTVKFKNAIFWNNTAPNGAQIATDMTSSITVQYSDVQGGWTGIGNINQYPAFVDTAQNNFHLLSSSPCIDTGDPNIIYNDPDGSRADMGCYYFPHYTSISLQPINPPIVIPPSGGSFNFTVTLENIGFPQYNAAAWCMIRLPNGALYGPVLGPVYFPVMPAGLYITRLRTQNVPANAPAGNYWLIANIGIYPNAFWDQDSIPFSKSTTGDGPIISDWENWGESFDEWLLTTEATVVPEVYQLSQNFPNPFNPATTIRFALPEAVHVSLAVYNVRGDLVATLKDENCAPGEYEVIWDGSSRASGIYFCQLRAGGYQQVLKMLLLK